MAPPDLCFPWRFFHDKNPYKLEVGAATVLGEDTAIPVVFSLFHGERKVVNAALLSIQMDLEGKNKTAYGLEKVSVDVLAALNPTNCLQAEILSLALI